jgi:hypothetical protein
MERLEVEDLREWALSGPLPDRWDIVPRPATTPWDEVVEEVIAEKLAKDAIATESLYCVARETGRFVLTHRAKPTQHVRRFIATRCGAPTSEIVTSFRSAEVPPNILDREIVARWRTAVASTLRAQLRGGGHYELGIWFGREDRTVLVTSAVLRRRARLEPLSMVPGADGSVLVKGELLEPMDRIHGLVTRGPLGFALCERDAAVAMPKFAFRCAAAKEDASAWVELAAFPPGRLLGPSVANLLVFPSGKPESVYRAPTLPVAAPAEGPTRDRLTLLVNGVRSAAGLTPVTLESAQSEVARSLAIEYFSATAGELPENATERVARTLIVGEKVTGAVRRGRFATGVAERGGGLDYLLGLTLLSPTARAVLLDPDASRLAVGELELPESKMVGVLFATYSLFSEAAHIADERTLMARLTELRAARGLPPPQKLELGPTFEGTGRALREGQRMPRELLGEILKRARRRIWRPLVGWSGEAGTLEQVAFPEEMLVGSPLWVAIRVAHYRPANDPLARYAVFFVMVRPPPQPAGKSI